ncbi:hypothetical protein CSKR_202945 [Clonorchis sinensis]|uniref:Uncharacterized protein n=2 Tax=Clonorchis sinensis TaxID=79923 RepID=A0A8T1M4R0_CLOSI|nr:hypothetical protein CSKR_202945 [Clonorchis sinensis]
MQTRSLKIVTSWETECSERLSSVRDSMVFRPTCKNLNNTVKVKITHDYIETEFPPSRVIGPRCFSEHTKNTIQPSRHNRRELWKLLIDLNNGVTIMFNKISAAGPGRRSTVNDCGVKRTDLTWTHRILLASAAQFTLDNKQYTKRKTFNGMSWARGYDSHRCTLIAVYPAKTTYVSTEQIFAFRLKHSDGQDDQTARKCSTEKGTVPTIQQRLSAKITLKTSSRLILDYSAFEINGFLPESLLFCGRKKNSFSLKPSRSNRLN